MDVAQWLNAIGLGQYEALFHEHEIDADVLPDLTEADLEKIGVPLGSRKRLMRAIAGLASSGAPPPAPKPAPAPPPPTARADAERRPITVMFCDLVGSTSLAARLDAEDWRNLVGAYLDEASAAVTALSGHVLKKLGDGLMALFGYPHAQENDAERAVRAALAIQRALADLNARNAKTGAPELAARIGLDMGPVVVDASGEVFGEAPNVAARVQAAAEPGTVLVTASVQRQTAGLFVAEDKGAHQLKGVPTPIALYRIVRASGGRRGGARALTPLVGREDELSQLQRRWSRALEGEGQFVQIVGEPGIGKSRLVEEFRAKLGETPHTWAEWSSSQLLQNTPLHPIAEWGRLRFGADLPAEQRLADLENTLGLIGLDPAEYAPLIAPLVDVPLPEDRRAKFAPEELRRRQLAAMTALVLAGARSQPVVLAFEDLHWADPTSLDLLRALVERGAQAPLLIVATTRPEFRPDWSLRSHHSVISLAPLDRAQVRKMVGEIASRHALSDEMIDGVGERTGGVPLFVEEVTRLLLERDAQGGAQAIPPTLQQSLAARLDRLGEAREVAQIGAVIGRDFSYRLLSDVSSSAAGFDEPRLQAALDRLTEADLLFVDGAPPAAGYRFKHALIQDAAYDSLLKIRRQALHRRAADALLTADAEPEAIAHHFTEAGLDDLAIEWWGKAGDQALRRSAFQEAIAHLGKAIAMADRAGPTPRRAPGGAAAPTQNLTQLHVAQANALLAARGYGAPETTEAFARARESASGDKDAPGRFAADFGLWAGGYTRGELPSMRAHAAALLKGLEARPDSPEACIAHRAAGITCWFAGEYLDARDHFERALALFQPGRDDDLAFRFGLDPGVSAMAYLAIALWPLGEVDRAISLIDRMQSRIALITHVGTLAFGTYVAAMFELTRGDHARAAPNAFELARVAREHDLPLFRAFGVFLEGLASAATGAPTGGLEGMRRGVEQLREQNVLLFDGLLKIALAEVEARAGDPDRAIAILDEALATSDRTGHRAFQAELHRVRGEILLKRDPASLAPAEEALLTAIAVAKQQSTHSFELRAALALAKLYQSTGRPVDAHAVLVPALEGFSPTPEMPEIAEAEALLAVLSQTDEVKAQATQRQRLTQLHVAYGNALVAARGYGAPETTEAFARAGESASGHKGAPERLAADWGLWAGSYTRGESSSMKAHAAALLTGVGARPDSAEASVAHRIAGVTFWFAGEYLEARAHLEHALALFQPGRDDDLAFRFGVDPGVNAMAYLAIASWALGEVDRAISLIDRMQTRIAALTHVGTLARGRMHAAVFELMRREPARAAPNAFQLARLAHEHDLPVWRAFGTFLEGWATAASGTMGDGPAEMRRGVELLREQNVLMFDGLLKVALAEAEGRAGDPDRAIAILDEALATCDRLGFRAFEAELHRARGEIVLKRDSADPAPAEEAFLTAIAVAGRQGTRSFELRAVLALAKLYQSAGRRAEAHAVLAPALEGFPPTSQMPEIAEAEALLATLAETDEVKAATTTRHKRVDLQIALGNALIAARGYGAAETQASFERARALTLGIGQEAERFSIAYGLYAVSYHRGDVARMREHASAFLSGVSGQADSPEAGVAHRISGIYSWYVGDLVDARVHLEKALAISDPKCDRDLAFRFGHDPRISASVQLGIVLWLLGEVVRAAQLFQDVGASIPHVSHLGTTAQGNFHAAVFEVMRGNHVRATEYIRALASVAYEHDLALWKTLAFFLQGWSAWHAGDRSAGLVQMRAGVAQLAEREISLFSGLIRAELAQAEAESGEVDASLITLENALVYCERIGQRWFDAEIHRIRGEILLKKHADSPAPAEDAYLAAIAIAQRQKARTFKLRAALSLARLYRSTDRPVEAHYGLAPAVEGFSPTPELPEIAEAQALLAALAETDEVKAETAQRQRLTQLQVAYGNALIAARGYGATETTEAFARARESAHGDNAPERSAADYGLWAGSFVRGELASMRMHAAAFLAGVAARPDSGEAGVAYRVHGQTHWFAGEFVEALRELERALALFQPGRDDDLAFRFAPDPGVAAMIYLAFASWTLGEVNRAVSLFEQMKTRISGLSHATTLALGAAVAAFFGLMRGDHPGARTRVSELARVVREHDLPLFRAFGEFLKGWATADGGALADGLEDMRRGVELLREQNVLLFDGIIKIALAEAEAVAGEPDRAIAILDEALATVDRTGYRAFEADLHRVHGEMLLKRNSANPAPAEEAFLTAIAVAKQQGTRSFELRGALALAKLYHSTGRPADAHAILAPALEGFAPTPEMPELAEAQALLATLAESEEVKAAVVARRQRLHLQISYGQAVMWSRGYAAEETKAAFARAQELAAGIGNAAERFDVYYSQWAGCMVRGEPESARATAESFRRDAKNEGTLPDLAAACRTAGRACLSLGDLSQARAHLEEVVEICDPEWDGEAKRRHGTDCESSATAYLAHVVWQFGEVERARQLIDHAVSRAVELAHIPTLVNVYAFKTTLEMFRADAQRTLRDAETLVEIAGRNGLAWFLNFGSLSRGWARARLSDRDAGMAEMRDALGKYADEGFWGFFPHFLGRLAELEAEGQGIEAALAHIDEAVTLARRTGEVWTDALLHRIRGDVLLKADFEHPVRAEDAYRAALSIARDRGARSFGLQAALKLAKLYQSTDRPADAHAVLAPALEGFSPTPEMPEIAEAQGLLGALSATDEVKAEATQRQRLTQLNVAYGNALFAARGWGAPETTEAFARARESASGDKDAPDRLAADWGLWAGSYMRGELPSMRAHAAAFLTDVEARPESPEAGVAHRAAGITCWFAGEYREARDHFERALALFRPGRDDDLAFRFGVDPGVNAMAYLAIASWSLGEVDRAISLIDRMQARIAALTHVGTLAFGRYLAAAFELMRGDHERAAPNAFELARLTREYDLNRWGAFGVFLQGWAASHTGAPTDGLEDMRRSAELLREQKVLYFDGLVKIALAEVEARAGDPNRAMAILDEALATCGRMGFRAFEAELHRARGEILFNRDPANPAPAEDALLTAVAVAKQQATRSFELRAALALATLYQSTGRPADAHAMLGPALEGFSPAPEMPEIADAQALLAALGCGSR